VIVTVQILIEGGETLKESTGKLIEPGQSLIERGETLKVSAGKLIVPAANFDRCW
jgi:hypothetical protein